MSPTHHRFPPSNTGLAHYRQILIATIDCLFRIRDLSAPVIRHEDERADSTTAVLVHVFPSENISGIMHVSNRMVRPNAHSTDAHAYLDGGYKPTLQISTDGFNAYPEAVDLAFGPHARYGTIIKEYRNAKQIYTPSEMVGTKRTGIRGIDNNHKHTINTSHVERLNGTQRLFMKRLNRLTYAFSKKLENLEAAFGMFSAYYNFCWQTRMKGTSGKKRPSAAMMAKIAGHVWSFDELFRAVLGG